MDVTVIAGLLGLGGAVIGAGATALVSLVQQRKDAQAERSRREEEAERDRAIRAEARSLAAKAAEEEARVAARLLQADTLQARLRVRAALKNDKYWSEPFALPQQSWHDYREQMARHLPGDGWTLVSRWFRSASSLEAQAVAARSLHEGVRRPQPTGTGRRQLQLALTRADQALQVLEQFTGDTDRTVDEEVVGVDADGPQMTGDPDRND